MFLLLLFSPHPIQLTKQNIVMLLTLFESVASIQFEMVSEPDKLAAYASETQYIEP